MNKDKYLAVDLGNVIIELDMMPFLSSIERYCNVGYAEAYAFLERTQRMQDLGLTSIENELVAHFDVRDNDTKEKILLEWSKTIKTNITTNAFLETKIKDGWKIALLSNMGTEHRSIIKNIIGDIIYNNSIHFFSCDVGARKPTYLYYKTFLDLHPDFVGSVYLDDKIENVETGKLFGLRAQQFILDGLKTKKEIREKLKSCLIY